MTSSAQQAQDRLITRSTPIWLLDIDGVLNAVQAEVQPGYERISTGYGPATYNPAVCRRIAALHQAGLFEIRWLTTWMYNANHLTVNVGLPVGLRVAGGQHFHSRNGWWKANAAREVAESNPDRLIIWTDDDLNDSYGASELDWMIGRPMVRVSPDPQLGLTDADVDAIEHACRAVALLPAGASDSAAGGVA